MSSAPTRIAAHLLVAFLLLILTSAFCHAQGRRVFPLIIDTGVVEMPESYRIQAADAYRTDALVVWGTWGVSSNGDSVCRVIGQRLTGGLPVGDPFAVHGDAARPVGRVSVVAVAEGYLVVWNDYRAGDSGEIYARAFGLDGRATTNAEYRFASGIMENQVVTYGNADSGRVIRWTSPGAWTNMVSIDRRMNVIQPVRRYKDVVREQYYDGGLIPDRTALMTLNNVILIDEDRARIDDASPQRSRLYAPFLLHRSGRFSMIRGDSLLTYASIHDAAPIHVTRLEKRELIAGAVRALAGNELDGASVVYAKLLADDTRPLQSLYFIGTFRLALLEQILDADGVVVRIDTVQEYGAIEGNYTLDNITQVYIQFDSATSKVTCGGTYLRYSVLSDKYYKGFHEGSSSDVALCAFTGPDGIARPPGYECFSLVSIDSSCIRKRESGLLVERLRSDSISSVRVEIDGVPQVVEFRGDVTPETFLVYDRTARTGPRGTYRGGEPYITFNTNTARNVVELDTPSRSFSAGSLVPIGRLKYQGNMGDVHDGEHIRTDTILSNYYATNEAHRHEVTILSRSVGVLDIYNNHVWGYFFAARNIISVATIVGWKTIDNGSLQFTSSAWDRNDLTVPVPTTAWEPNGGTTMIRYHYRGSSDSNRQIVVSIDDSGRFAGRVSWNGSSKLFEQMFPEAVGIYLGVRNDSLFRVQLSGISSLGRLPGTDSGMIYTRGFGYDFFRYRTEVNGTVTIELMTFAPRALRRRTVEIVGLNSTYTFIANSGDSSLTILWYDSLGINALTLSKDFSRLIPTRRLVEKTQIYSMTGVFKNDSLHIVWEDARDGIRTLYRQGIAVAAINDTLWTPMAKGGEISRYVQYEQSSDIVSGIENGVSVMGNLSGHDAVDGIVYPPVRTTPDDPNNLGEQVQYPLISPYGDIVTLTPIPNPASASVELRVRLTYPWPVTITLADERGRVVLRREALASVAGENVFTLEVGELMPGAYTVVMEAGTARGEGALLIVR